MEHIVAEPAHYEALTSPALNGYGEEGKHTVDPAATPQHQSGNQNPPAAAAFYSKLSCRPALHLADDRQFEDDVVAFLDAIGEDKLAKNVRGRHIACNNTAMDLLGLYRAVVCVGGLTSNESYDAAGRYSGSINWAGEIFPAMHNFKRGHRATSIGTQLLTNYRKYLAAYEKAWADVDLATYAGRPLVQVAPGLAQRYQSADLAAHAAAATADVGPEGGGEEAGGVSASAARSPIPPVAPRDPPLAAPRRPPPLPSAPSPVMMRLAALELTGTRPPAGTLLIVHNLSGPTRRWPGIIASSEFLPSAVASGGLLAHAAPQGVLQPLDQTAGASSSVDQALPVLLLGTTTFGWAGWATCEDFEPSVLALPPSSLPDSRGALPADGGLHARAVKHARQLHQLGTENQDDMRTAAKMVLEAAAVHHLAAQLLAVENNLPLTAMTNPGWRQWSKWRAALPAVTTVADLLPRVVELAAGIRQQAMLSSLDRLLTDLHAQPPSHVTVASADRACAAVIAAIDWASFSQ